jgi:hypothetical protein
MARRYPTPLFPFFEDPSESTEPIELRLIKPMEPGLIESMEADLRAMKCDLTPAMKCGKRSTKAQRAVIIAAYAAGKPISQLSEMTGFSMRTLRLILIKEGIKRRPRGTANRRFTAAEIEDIRRRWNSDEPSARISKSLNLSVSTFNRILKEIGEDPRRNVPKGKNHSRWKGGRIVTEPGYVVLHLSVLDRQDIAEPMANHLGYVLEHRYLMACELGRPLTENETVHHKNGVRDANWLDNLQLRTGQHGAGQKFQCLDCGSCNVAAVELDD